MKLQILQTLLFAATSLVIAVPRELENRIISGEYIIRLHPNSSLESIEAHLSRRDGKVRNVFQFGDFKAYTGAFSEEEIATIKDLPEVLSVEPDALIVLEPTLQNTTGIYRRKLVTNSNAPWHLGDLSHKAAGSTEYVFDKSGGNGMTVYIVDTGIRLTHHEFEGRAIFGYNAILGSSVQQRRNTDTVGHGTYVAGIAIGKTHGVANKATAIDVKVFHSDQAQTSWVIAGFSWAVNDILKKGSQHTSVINLSFGKEFERTTMIESAVISAYKLGVISVVAAGNLNSPARTQSPARVLEAITVGMIGPDRARAVYTERGGALHGSSYGPELDVFAPGVGVVAASYTSDTGYETWTGTSGAAPLVAGLICYLRGLESLASPEEVRGRLVKLAHKNVVSDPKGSPNLLVYNGSGK